MERFIVFLLVFIFIAGAMAGCFISGIARNIESQKAALECEYNYDNCPYCGKFLLD